MNLVPPSEAFERPIQTKEQTESPGTYSIPDILDVTKTEAGEMAVIYGGHPLPRKGMTYYEVTAKNNEVKRVTLALFAPWSSLKKGFIPFIESYLENYNRLVEGIYTQCIRVPYLKKNLYARNCQAIWDVIKIFLIEIGIKESIADHTGKIVATFLQYDDAYRLPFADAMDELTLEEFIKNPGKAINKFFTILSGRTTGYYAAKFKSIGTLLKWLLYIPKFKRAFKKAIQSVPFEWFQTDKYDYYWTLPKDDYLYDGRPIEDRANEQLKMMIEHTAKTTGCKEVRCEKISEKEVKIIPIF